MSSALRAEIAARIRGLIGGRDASIGAAALRLRVDETALRMSLDEISPYPTIDVVAAVVRDYGVDPTWLLTGMYNRATHRTSLELRTDELPAAINDVIAAARRTEEGAGLSLPRISQA